MASTKTWAKRAAAGEHVLFTAVALLGVACASEGGGVVDGVQAPATRGAGTSMTSAPLAETAAPVDTDHVNVIGMVEQVSVDARAGAGGGPIAGAEVCLTVSGDTTCTITDDGGVYGFDGVEKTTEPAEIIVTRDGFATTVTNLSVEHDASHVLGLVADSAVDKGSGIVVVRSLLKAYTMTNSVPGVQVSVTAGTGTFGATTEGEGTAVFMGLTPGAVTVSSHASTLHCDVWTGSSLGTSPPALEARAGVVTEIDVLCNVDNNDKK